MAAEHWRQEGHCEILLCQHALSEYFSSASKIHSAGWRHLGAEGEEDGAGVDEAWDSKVLDALAVKDGGARLEPGDVVGAIEQLWGHAA